MLENGCDMMEDSPNCLDAHPLKNKSWQKEVCTPHVTGVDSARLAILIAKHNTRYRSESGFTVFLSPMHTYVLRTRPPRLHLWQDMPC